MSLVARGLTERRRARLQGSHAFRQAKHAAQFRLAQGVHAPSNAKQHALDPDRIATRADAAVASLLRLIELQSVAGDWPKLDETVHQLLAVNPLLTQAQRARAIVAERLNNTHEAQASLEALLLMEPDDAAELHYRLAKLLHQQGNPLAKSHVLEALEAAPRYRDAQKLLLQIVREKK